ncbi:hypothetical protein BPAE_0041g00310 [Botrytis paeoniae]|uniref:Uncharacterized protein n=1 Tax=Botrytis paeoniae TaxID=278948 RepID=A0A4Z1G0E0_9HELO|nr:hypothetical protein BPAE_0041g00310 [Botrytis paeoniae]
MNEPDQTDETDEMDNRVFGNLIVCIWSGFEMDMPVVPSREIGVKYVGFMAGGEGTGEGFVVEKRGGEEEDEGDEDEGDEDEGDEDEGDEDEDEDGLGLDWGWMRIRRELELNQGCLVSWVVELSWEVEV